MFKLRCLNSVGGKGDEMTEMLRGKWEGRGGMFGMRLHLTHSQMIEKGSKQFYGWTVKKDKKIRNEKCKEGCMFFTIYKRIFH